MADPILPRPGDSDQPRRGRERDYKAERRRREQIARDEGWPSYWAKRVALYGDGHVSPRRRTRRQRDNGPTSESDAFAVAS